MMCLDFARQLSYHRALSRFRDDSGKFNLNFWTAVFNNSIDIATLDWLHLFGSDKDDLHWKKIVKDVPAFRSSLFASLGLYEQGWKSYRETVKTYRDKDVAHIEVRPRGWVPEMTLALKAADLYYKYVLSELSHFRDYSNEPADLIAYFEDSQRQTERILSLAYSSTSGMKEELI